jgi:hypothetical protein
MGKNIINQNSIDLDQIKLIPPPQVVSHGISIAFHYGQAVLVEPHNIASLLMSSGIEKLCDLFNSDNFFYQKKNDEQLNN